MTDNYENLSRFFSSEHDRALPYTIYFALSERLSVQPEAMTKFSRLRKKTTILYAKAQ
jgi:hypothetical protein